MTQLAPKVIRIATPGWLLFFCGLPLLIVIILHTMFLNGAIQKIPDTKPIYAYLIVVSNLFFFLGFVLQVDGGDAPGIYVPIFLPLLSGVSFPSESNWPVIFFMISVGSFVALLISWILLLTLSNSLFKREKLN